MTRHAHAQDGRGDAAAAERKLVVEDLRVAYGRIPAVRGIDLEVRPGEIVALVGANGAGKSTTLAAIVGLVPSSATRMTYGSFSLLDQRPEEIARQGMSLVPESRRIFINLTVEENLLIGATTRGDQQEARADIDRWLDYFGALKRYRRRPARYLSGGEQQQLAIARALIANPKLLLLDEPSLGLAPLLVNQVFETIADLRSRGVTILVAEQYVSRMLELADRVYALGRGQVVASGRPDEVRDMAELSADYVLGGDVGGGS